MGSIDSGDQTRAPRPHRGITVTAILMLGPLALVLLTSLVADVIPSAAAEDLNGAFFRLPVNISHSPSPTSHARISPRSIALDPHGYAYALWVERLTHSAGVTREIALSMYRPGAGWDSLMTPVAWWDGEESTDPACAIDRGRTIHLVWTDRRTGRPQVFAQLFNPDRAIQTEPLQLSDDRSVTADPAVAVGPDGWVHVAWSEIHGSSSIVRHRAAAPGGHWLEIDGPLIAGEPPAYSPDLTVDQDGRAHLVWEWGATQGVGIGHAVWSPDAGWSAGTQLVAVEDGRYAQTPVIAAAPGGGLWVAWAELDREGSSLLALHQSAGGGWDEEWRQVSYSEIEVVSPAIAVDRWGVAHLLWQEALPPDEFGEQTTAIMYAALRADRPSFVARPRSLTTPSSGPNRGPMIATDETGRILAAWLDESSGPGDLVSRMGVTGFARPGR